MAVNKEDAESGGKFEVITSKILRSPPWLGWSLRNICFTNDHGYVPCRGHNPVLSILKTYYWAVNRRNRTVPHMEQELLTILERMCLPIALVGFVLLDI